MRTAQVADAPELQEKSQRAVLAGVWQRARQAKNYRPGSRSSNGEPNRYLQ